MAPVCSTNTRVTLPSIGHLCRYRAVDRVGRELCRLVDEPLAIAQSLGSDDQATPTASERERPLLLTSGPAVPLV